MSDAAIVAFQKAKPSAAKTAGPKRPPKHLKAPGKKLWKQICEAYEVTDPMAELCLTRACEGEDRLADLRAEVEAKGMWVDGAGGTQKANPCIALEVSVRGAVVRSLQAIGINYEPIKR